MAIRDFFPCLNKNTKSNEKQELTSDSEDHNDAYVDNEGNIFKSIKFLSKKSEG